MDLIPSSSPQKAAQKQEGRNGGQMLDGAEGGLCAQASTLFSHQQEKIFEARVARFSPGEKY